MFGKHSGTAAVEAVLAEQTPLLHAHGVVVDEDLVNRVLERVKVLREASIRTGAQAAAVDQFYENYRKLGIAKEALVELALEAAAARNRV